MINVEKLNSLSNDIFTYKSVDSEKKTIKINSANGERKINRDEIVTSGRLATLEYFGQIANADKDNLVKYNSRVKNYGGLQKKVWEDTVLYCAGVACKNCDREPYGSMKELAADINMYRDPIFWRTLAYISQDVIEPLFPAIIPAATDRLINWNNGRLGETKLIDVPSNDFFVFDDDSWGSVSSKPYQYLYKAQISVTPKPYTAKAKIKWYQDIIDGEAGRYYAAFMRGAYNKMYAIMIDRFKAAVGNSKYVPSGLQYDSFSAANWTNAIMVAETLNGVRRDQLMAMGTLSSLSQIVPTVGSPAVAAGIQGQIGVEWARNGFLANVFGVDLIEAGLGVVPGTQNYDPKFFGLDDATSENVYIFAKIGRAPMEGVIADGSPITITFTPEETADMTINISETIIFDVAPAFSQKIIKIAM